MSPTPPGPLPPALSSSPPVAPPELPPRPEKLPDDLRERSWRNFMKLDNWNPAENQRYPVYTDRGDKKPYGCLKGMVIESVHRMVSKSPSRTEVNGGAEFEHFCHDYNIPDSWSRRSRDYFLLSPEMDPSDKNSEFYDVLYNAILTYEKITGKRVDIDGSEGMTSPEIRSSVMCIRQVTEKNEYPRVYTLAEQMPLYKFYGEKNAATVATHAQMGEIVPIAPAAQQLPDLTGVNDVAPDITQIGDIHSLKKALELNADTLNGTKIEEGTATSKEYLVAQYIINEIYGNGRTPTFEIVGDQLMIDGETIDVGQTLESTDIHREVALIFFKKSNIQGALGESIALDKDVYSSRDRAHYYEKTLAPVLFDPTKFDAFLKERLDNPGHVAVIEYLEKNLHSPLDELRASTINGLATLDKTMDSARVKRLGEESLSLPEKFKYRWDNMNPAAKALGVVALVVFGSVMSIKKFGFWKSLAGGTGLLFANYFATGHFSPLRTVGDIFSTTSEFTSAAVKSITETLEKDRNKPVNDPEVLAQIILNETAGFRDGEFDEYFTNPKNDGSSEDARRYIIQALANGVPEFGGDPLKVKEVVEEGRNKLFDQLRIVGKWEAPGGETVPIYSTQKNIYFEADGVTPNAGFIGANGGTIEKLDNLPQIVAEKFTATTENPGATPPVLANINPSANFKEYYESLRNVSEKVGALDETAGVVSQVGRAIVGGTEWVRDTLVPGTITVTGNLADALGRLTTAAISGTNDRLGDATSYLLDETSELYKNVIKPAAAGAENGIFTIADDIGHSRTYMIIETAAGKMMVNLKLWGGVVLDWIKSTGGEIWDDTIGVHLMLMLHQVPELLPQFAKEWLDIDHDPSLMSQPDRAAILNAIKAIRQNDMNGDSYETLMKLAEITASSGANAHSWMAKMIGYMNRNAAGGPPAPTGGTVEQAITTLQSLTINTYTPNPGTPGSPSTPPVTPGPPAGPSTSPRTSPPTGPKLTALRGIIKNVAGGDPSGGLLSSSEVRTTFGTTNIADLRKLLEINDPTGSGTLLAMEEMLYQKLDTDAWTLDQWKTVITELKTKLTNYTGSTTIDATLKADYQNALDAIAAQVN